ncbi:hypothetical protein LCY76_14480 [Fictibacillus sp. KIGAM418]|uniref:Uncharacterized protein n=1 Tax=Fictibacillus marinisediminis TaxID=2878389 RepID=A0A9X1XBH4_9BACL|nr:hypothetical protein [Fictibacillus marinisediminis]MCK6257792.1 hypothetical protein [Fictibacillus marinisediminis]
MYLITQFIVIQKFFTHTFYSFAPKYLIFSGSSYLIPLLLAVLVGCFLKWSKDKDWGILETVSYYAVVNIVLSIFLIVPYVL